jgi:diguanylate cyclase (GGDEF)-like protein
MESATNDREMEKSLPMEADRSGHWRKRILESAKDPKLLEETVARIVKIESETTEDALTGLLNFRGWEKFSKILYKNAQENQTPLSLILGDVDGLKNINDTKGHAAGSESLAEIAKILQEKLGEGAVVARTGGDEFSALLPSTVLEQATLIVKKIIGGLEEKLQDSSPDNIFYDSQLGISLGVIEVDMSHGESIEAAHHRADQHMYQVKSAKKNV